jgi:hypothetical protein
LGSRRNMTAGKPSFLEAPWAVQRSNIVFFSKYAFIAACHGSPKTQNIKDAIAHAQSGKPLARRAAQQMPPVWKQPAFAHRLRIVRLLSRATGVDARKQMIVAVAL